MESSTSQSEYPDNTPWSMLTAHTVWNPPCSADSAIAGKRIVAMGFPTTYPPEPVNGIMISGFDSPLSFQADRSFCYPPSLWKELKKKVSAYTLAGIQELDTGKGWHHIAEANHHGYDRDSDIDRRISSPKRALGSIQHRIFRIRYGSASLLGSSRQPLTQARQFGGDHADFLRNVYIKLDKSVKRLIDHLNRDALIIRRLRSWQWRGGNNSAQSEPYSGDCRFFAVQMQTPAVRRGRLRQSQRTGCNFPDQDSASQTSRTFRTMVFPLWTSLFASVRRSPVPSCKCRSHELHRLFGRTQLLSFHLASRQPVSSWQKLQ